MNNNTLTFQNDKLYKKGHRLAFTKLVELVVVALLFMCVGGLIMAVFKPWGRQFFLPTENFFWRIGLSSSLILITWLFRRSNLLNKYSQLLSALAILSVALSMDWVFGNLLGDTLKVRDGTPAGFTNFKLDDFFVITCVILVLNRLYGGSLGSLYIQKGNLKLGLIIGVGTFVLAAVGSVAMARLLFMADGLTLQMVIPWIPWVLLAALANGAMEELAFRGLFLKKLEPFFGKFLSTFFIAIVFTLLHKGASYTSDELMFLAATFPLAVLWGYITQKTDSLWGAILFHAGMDIPIFLGIFYNL